MQTCWWPLSDHWSVHLTCSSLCGTEVWKHYDDVRMGAIASQITSLAIVYSTVYSDADQSKHQSSASLGFVWGIHRDRWIPRTKGQLRGICFHLMTSSWPIGAIGAMWWRISYGAVITQGVLTGSRRILYLSCHKSKMGKPKTYDCNSKYSG